MARTDHWKSKLSTNIQFEKKYHSAFLIFEKLSQNIKKILYFWHILDLSFLLSSNNCFFYMLSAIYLYLSLLFSYFVFLFSPSFLYSSLRKAHFTIYNVWFDFITTWPQYYGDKKKLHSPLRKKRYLIFSWYKVWVFVPPYQYTFFLVLDQATDQKMLF